MKCETTGSCSRSGRRSCGSGNSRLQRYPEHQESRSTSYFPPARRQQRDSTRAGRIRRRGGREPARRRSRRARQQELDRMQEALSKIVDTRRTPNGMLITLPDSTFRFNFDSAELNQKNRELLSRVAGILLVSKGYGLSVFGYTDDVGSDDYNQQLSMRRAKAVEDYLVKAGIDPAIINVKGYGKTSPLVPGTTTLARAKNRRVEIALTDSEIKYVGETPSGDR